MKKYLFIFIMFFICAHAYALVEYTENTDVGVFNDDIKVYNDVTVTAFPGQNIKIEETFVDLYNNGTIAGTIDTQGNVLRVYNTGVISGGIISTINDGEVIQMITTHDEITNIGVVGVNHIVDINYANQEILFNEIKDLPAGSFSLSNAKIMIDDFHTWQTWGQSVSLEGPVKLIIANMNTVNSGEDIANIVSGVENLTVDITDIDSLHTINLVESGQTKTLYLVHEPNNDIAIGGGNSSTYIGPLEQIRLNNPNDKLVRALDAANSSEEIKNIMDKSYRFNHGILLRPIKVINNFAIFDRLEDKNEFGMGLDTFYINSDTTKDFGGRIYIANNFEDLYLNFGFSFNSFSYEDNLNDFSGAAYGLDIRAKQNFDNFWVDGFVGVTLVQYDANYITSSNELKDNPFGSSEYARLDFGYNFDVFTDLVISPFVGIVAQEYNVNGVSDFDMNLHGGSDVKYSVITDGIKYEYDFRGSLSVNGDWFSSVKIGFWSVTDKVGASFNVGLFKNDIDYHYKLSLNAKTVF